MKLKNPKDFWSGVMFAMVGFAFALVVKWSEYPMGTGARMGAGYFPFVLGIVLGLLGIAIIVESFATVGTPIAKFAWRPLLWVLGAFIVFGVTAQLLGLALAIMLLVILSTYGEKKVAPIELMAYVPVILGVLAFGYAWQLAVITLQLPDIFSRMAVVGGMGVVWLTTTLGMVASAISTAFVTGGIAAATAILFVIARKRKFCESMAETTLSAGILASASWAVFVVGLKLPFPVWPAFFG